MHLPRFLDRSANDLAIDLGTANTLVYSSRDGILLNEPSVVAIRHEGGPRGKKSVLAVGRAAHAMLGRAPDNIETIRPMRDGVIADFAVTEQMLKHLLARVLGRRMFHHSPRVVVCVPSGSSQVERRAIRESVLGAGARDVRLLEEPMAAALGAGLPVEAATGSMVVDIGGGTTEVGVIALGGMVHKCSVRQGGDKMDEAIIQFMRRRHGMLIGQPTAEHIKKTIGSALPDAQARALSVFGMDVAEGMPTSISIDGNAIHEALGETLGQITTAVKSALEQAPPELAADILAHGIVLTGGGGLLRQLDALLSRETGTRVQLADEPLTCVVRGCGMALAWLDRRQQMLAVD